MKKIIKWLPIVVLLYQCDNDDDKTIELNPKACFETSETTYFTGEEISFENCSTNSEKYIWDFEVSTSEEKNPTFSYTKVGDYNIKLTSFKQDKSDTVEKKIKIIENQEGIGEIQNSISCEENTNIIDWTISEENNLYVLFENEKNKLNLTKYDSSGSELYTTSTFLLPLNKTILYISFGSITVINDKVFVSYNIRHRYETETGRKQDGWLSYFVVIDNNGNFVKDYKYENNENRYDDHYVSSSYLFNEELFFIGGKGINSRNTWLLKLNLEGDVIEDKIISEQGGTGIKMAKANNGDWIIGIVDFRVSVKVLRMDSSFLSTIWTRNPNYSDLSTYYQSYYNLNMFDFNEKNQRVYIVPPENEFRIYALNFEGGELNIPKSVDFHISCSNLTFTSGDEFFVSGCKQKNTMLLKKFDSNANLLKEKLFPENVKIHKILLDSNSEKTKVLLEEKECQNNGIINFREYFFY